VTAFKSRTELQAFLHYRLDLLRKPLIYLFDGSGSAPVIMTMSRP
jgi:hypothetical protein